MLAGFVIEEHPICYELALEANIKYYAHGSAKTSLDGTLINSCA